VFIFGDVTAIEGDDWDRALTINVKGFALCIKHVARTMQGTGRGGSIINMGSISSFVAQPAFVPYSTTKGAILQLTRCCAADLGPAGIRVNCVCPGAIGARCLLRRHTRLISARHACDGQPRCIAGHDERGAGQGTHRS
jgi:NAD(P)-dependent dehydrogenase (short-subunit alcohol dehydrogenase family)